MRVRFLLFLMPYRVISYRSWYRRLFIRLTYTRGPRDVGLIALPPVTARQVEMIKDWWDG